MRKLIGLLIAILLIGCGDGVDPNTGIDKDLLERRWTVQQVTVGTSPSVPLNQEPYLIFELNGQITSNFLSNCYSYSVRKEGEIVATNNCIDCGCPPGGCANGLACNQTVWTYQQPTNKTLLLTISGRFSGVFVAR